MKVWIIFVGETLPMDSKTRLWRYGMLAESLVARGHQVTRWAPSFNHAHKTQRCHADYTYQVNENYKIELIYNRGYKRNIGFQRLLSYIHLTHLFKQRIKNEKPPDIIISGMPTPWLCSAAVNYGRQKNIPVIVDIRDLWPDIFLDVFPKYLKNIGKLALDALFGVNKDVFKNASSITAISAKYLEWGLKYANRAKTKNDRIFYMGYKQKSLTDQMQVDLYKFWEKLGVSQQRFICCFFGSLNRQFNIESVIYKKK
jgi:glycosyltransferase involved in cell wall biosynthesis